MPAELMHLNEQLLNLNVVYEAAVLGNKTLGDIRKIDAQFKEVEKAIVARKEFISRNQCT